MKDSLAVDLVQKSELQNKTWFLKLVNELSQEDFEKFCKEIMHLRHFYDTTIGAYATDQKHLAIINSDIMWEIQEIDFDADVNFKKIKQP